MLLGKTILASSAVGHVEMLQTAGSQGGLIFDWHKSNDFTHKLKHILGFSTTKILELEEKARTIILKMSGHENVLSKRIVHLQKVIGQNKDTHILHL